MALNQKYNSESILVRSVIAGLLNILNNKIQYEQVWSNDDIEVVKIPWFYNMKGDERFMQDFYTHYAYCLPPKPVDGNFDMIPRGVITYKGSSINSQRITSRYVQGTYLKEINGQLQTMRSFLYYIPLDIDFEAEMWFDTLITALKVEQIIRELFYKTIVFYVYYKGMRIGCCVGFPEDYTPGKADSYNYDTTDNKIKISFNLKVEAYQPVFDPTTEVNNNELIKSIGYRLYDANMPKNDGIIKITPETDISNTTISKGWPYLIEWDTKDENAIINAVDILWAESGSSEKNIIEKNYPNNEYYVWNIPKDFTDFKPPTIIWPDSSSGPKVYREPVISILPELTTNKILSSSFNIIDSGYFISPSPDASFNIILEMKDTQGKIVYSGDSSIYVNLEANKIKEIIVPNEDVIFPGDVFSKTIDIYIVNSLNTLDLPVSNVGDESYGVIRNVTIV